MSFVQPTVYFPATEGRFVTFRVSLARKEMSSYFLVETSSFVSEKGLTFMLRFNVSMTRSYSLRETKRPQQRERLRPGFFKADSLSEVNS